MSTAPHSTSIVFCFAFVSLLLSVAQSQDAAYITIDKELVYDKENFTIKCSFPRHLYFKWVTLDAFNDTSLKGSMYCDVSTGNSTQTGVFAGTTFAGCPTYPGGSGYVSVTVQASPTLELNYNCTFRLHNGSRFFSLRSDTTRFELSVMPEPVFTNPPELSFKESDDVTFGCYSKFGKPPAIVNLTVAKWDHFHLRDIGNVSVAVRIPQPARQWHNAFVTCKVENHRFSPNMTLKKVLNISFLLYPDPNRGFEFDTTLSSAKLDCSTSSNPPPIYNWNNPAGVEVEYAQPFKEYIIVPRLASGTFVCTIVNPATGKHVVATFYVKCFHVEIICGVVISVAIITGGIVVFILYKQGRLSNGCKRPENSQAPTISS